MFPKPVYLDNAATTCAEKIAVDCMAEYGADLFYNPSAGYAKSLEVKKDLAEATENIASLLGAERGEIIFTSCATESNNTAFECGIRNKKGNVVVSSMEHASVYESAMRLKSRGMDVRFIPLENGRVTEKTLLDTMDENTSFVSVIHCSNETGAVNDIAVLCAAAKEKSPKCVFHSDGVQAFCKIATDMKRIGVDLYSVSAHKVGGMKGVGALYVRKGFNIPSFIVGGGQQDGRRAGTENVGGIIGFAKAAVLYKECADKFDGNAMRRYLIEKFGGKDWIRINGECDNTGYILSLSFKNLRGEVIAHMAEEKGVLVGLGSACSSHIKSNRVLEAMGVPRNYSEGSIRISFSPKTTFEEVKYAAGVIAEAAEKLRKVING